MKTYTEFLTEKASYKVFENTIQDIPNSDKRYHVIDEDGYRIKAYGDKTLAQAHIDYKGKFRKWHVKDSKTGEISESTPAGKEVPGAEGSEGALKYVKQVNGKWALVSRHTGRPLKYFSSKPSREEAGEALRHVEYFKHS